MNRAYYDSKPTIIDAVGNGNYLYRWDIQEEKVTLEQEERVQYSCYEVTIIGKPTYEKCVEAVIRNRYTSEQEMALVNKYNSYQNGIISDTSILDEYKEYLKYIFDVKILVKKDLELEAITSIAKQKKLQEITAYDTSSNVNGFILDGEEVWLDKDTRVGLMNSTNIQKAAGQETTTLWFEGKSYTIPCDTAIQMLSALELYALECYNTTAQHKANVEALTTKEEVEAYDYTTGYPEKLNFNTEL